MKTTEIDRVLSSPDPYRGNARKSDDPAKPIAMDSPLHTGAKK